MYLALFDVDVGSPNGARWTEEAGDRLGADVKRALGSLQKVRTVKLPSEEATRLACEHLRKQLAREQLPKQLARDHLGKPDADPPPDAPVDQWICMQANARGAPSVIWTVQTIGSLLELGFTPEAECVKTHLKVIALLLEEPIWRDAEPDLRNPYHRDLGAPWVIRARHMAWILGCLAEYQPPTIATGLSAADGWSLATGSPEADDRAAGADKALRDLIRLAYEGLVGSPHKRSPAAWISPRRRVPGRELPEHETPELAWYEGWPVSGARPDGRTLEPRQNLLTTIYAVLSICRAERHGYRRDEDAWQAVVRDEQPASVLVTNLISQIHVQPAANGPTVTLTGDWLEPWANAHTLPPSVIGLLALALVEYTRFLAQIIKPEESERDRVRGAFIKAQRLAESLLARPSFISSGSARVNWSRGVDAFFQKGGGGAWFVATCSVCVRAVLETGVADPTHPLVRDAVDTLAFLEVDPDQGGWLDPTYHTSLDALARDAASKRHLSRRRHPEARDTSAGLGLEHAEMDVRKLPGRDAWQATPASVYGAALALSAVRRAWSRADPRTAPSSPRTPVDGDAKPPARVLGASAFDRIVIEGLWTPFVVNLGRSDESYSERAMINLGTHDLLKALTDHEDPATAREIQARLGRIRAARGTSERPVPRQAAAPALDTPSAIDSRIDKTNLFFGFQLIESQPPTSGIGTRYRISESIGVEFREIAAPGR